MSVKGFCDFHSHPKIPWIAPKAHAAHHTAAGVYSGSSAGRRDRDATGDT